MLKLAVLGALVILGFVEAKSENVQLAPEKVSKLTQDAIHCAGEVGVDPGLLIQIKDKKYSDDVTVKKFIFCAFKRTGISSKKGIIKVDNFLDIYPEKVDKEALKKVMLECQQENGEPLDKIYNFFKCYQEKTPVHISLSRN